MKTNFNYYKRVCDRQLANLLDAIGAVLVTGPKWCGKTSTALNCCNSVLYMQNPDKRKSNMDLADTMPSLLLKGDSPRLIDEWQIAPNLWDAVRFEVDQRQKPGQFILTGSAVPKDNATMHTGTGRIARMMMRPMSLFESLDSNGEVSIKDLFDGKTEVASVSNLDIPKIAYLICRGGWPVTVGMKEKDALTVAINYVEAIINEDGARLDGVEKNPGRVRQIMRSLARNISTLVNNQTIISDVVANDISISDKTLSSYLNVLERIFVIENQPAWAPSLRSKTAIRTSHKRQFIDPSIATAVLRANPESILQDFNYFGFLFESLCTRDMRVYAQANDGEVYHYRDKSGLESDMIIRLHDGRWAAVEVKLGSKQIEEASENLIELSKKIDSEKVGEPSFLMVLTGGEYAYRRKDGVIICPIGCLKD